MTKTCGKSKIKDFKRHEMFSKVKVPPGIPFFVRVDGKGFHRLISELKFAKPYDEKFMNIMVCSAKAVFEIGFNPVLAYIFSDEISFLFIKNFPYDGRIEKMDSLIPSAVASAFTLKLVKENYDHRIVLFDARIIPVSHEDIRMYLAWRQMEAWRNCMNAYAQMALEKMGYKGYKLAEKLKGMKAAEMHELVFKELGINLAKVPTWQRRGIMIRWKKYEKVGYNPILKRYETAWRRKIQVDWELPLFNTDKGKKYLEEVLASFEV